MKPIYVRSLFQSSYLSFIVLGFGTATNAFGEGKSPSVSVDDVGLAASKSAIAIEAGVNAFIQKKTEVIDFSPGSSVIGADQLRAIKALMKSSTPLSSKEQIYLAAWSDLTTKSGKAEKVSVGNALLAEERIRAVADALKKIGILSEVISVNVETSDSKSVFTGKSEKIAQKIRLNEDSSDYALNEAGRILKEQGGPQKAVLYIQK